MPFKNWFENKLTVGAFPLFKNEGFDPKEYDYCINVSDEYYSEIDFEISIVGCKTFWFPMNECKKDNGLNSIYGAMVILHDAESRDKSVYLHCHAGIHRSQLVKSAYYFLRTGEHFNHIYGSFINPLYHDCTKGYLPPIKEMESFLGILARKLKNLKPRLMGGALDDCKICSIKTF